MGQSTGRSKNHDAIALSVGRAQKFCPGFFSGFRKNVCPMLLSSERFD